MIGYHRICQIARIILEFFRNFFRFCLSGKPIRVVVQLREGVEHATVLKGTVIAKKHGGIEETVTVRRVSYGIGVEKVFPVHSPSIDHFEVVRNGKVRRAKLYYLRGRVGKGAKVKEKL